MRLPRVEDIEKRIPSPEDFTSRARGTELTARIGTALGIAFGSCFLTGLWSHFQYTSPGWLPIGPNPAWFYRVTQGLHVMSGMAAIPLLLYHEKIGENFNPQEVGTWLIYLAAVLTLWSMAYYLKVAIPQALKHG